MRETRLSGSEGGGAHALPTPIARVKNALGEWPRTNLTHKYGYRCSVDAVIPIVGATARVHVELLADAIDSPFQVAVLHLGDWMNASAFEEQVRDENAAQMRRVG